MRLVLGESIFHGPGPGLGTKLARMGGRSGRRSSPTGVRPFRLRRRRVGRARSCNADRGEASPAAIPLHGPGPLLVRPRRGDHRKRTATISAWGVRDHRRQSRVPRPRNPRGGAPPPGVRLARHGYRRRASMMRRIPSGRCRRGRGCCWGAPHRSLGIRDELRRAAEKGICATPVRSWRIMCTHFFKNHLARAAGRERGARRAPERCGHTGQAQPLRCSDQEAARRNWGASTGAAWPLSSQSMRSMSARTMMLASSAAETLAFQPSFISALAASPMSASTSVGRR